MSKDILAALSIMGSGMLGIFVAIIIIMVFVWAFGKFGSAASKKGK